MYGDYDWTVLLVVRQRLSNTVSLVTVMKEFTITLNFLIFLSLLLEVHLNKVSRVFFFPFMFIGSQINRIRKSSKIWVKIFLFF